MVEVRSDETIFSLDEKKKVILGQKTTIEEFEPMEMQTQVQARKDLIKESEAYVVAIKEELDQIAKLQKKIDEWNKERIEEQKRQVAEQDKKDKLKSSSPSKSPPN